MPSWTTGEVDRARSILGNHVHATLALPEISEALKRPITIGALKKQFVTHGLGPVSRYLKSRSPDPVFLPSPKPREPEEDLLVKRERERKETRVKRERDELLERLAEAEARFKFCEAISADPPDSALLLPRESSSGMREGALVVLASDWHVGENVYPDAVADRNVYHPEIARIRASRFFDGVSWMTDYHRQKFSIRDVILWLGGDLITGYIHPELEEDNDLSPTEEVLFAKGLLVSGIRRLLEDPQTERILIPCNFGNHGRTTVKRRIKTGAKNSFEWLLYMELADKFEDEPRVQFVIPRSAHTYVDAYGWRLHFTHGDEVNYWGGVGGLSIPLNKRIPKWDRVKESDFHHVGHFHQFLDLGHTLVNGSLIGYTEYAMSAGCDFEPPQQACYVLDSRRGKCFVSPIWVDEDAPLKRAA